MGPSSLAATSAARGVPQYIVVGASEMLQWKLMYVALLGHLSYIVHGASAVQVTDSVLGALSADSVDGDKQASVAGNIIANCATDILLEARALITKHVVAKCGQCQEQPDLVSAPNSAGSSSFTATVSDIAHGFDVADTGNRCHRQAKPPTQLSGPKFGFHHLAAVDGDDIITSASQQNFPT